MSASFATILAACAPVFLLLFIGFGTRKTGILPPEADTGLMRLIVRVLYPCLYLNFLIGNPTFQNAANVYLPPLIGFLLIILGYLLGYAGGRSLGLAKGKGLRTFTFCSGIFNYGYIPIPLIAALFTGPETIGVLLIFNVGVEIAIWTVGILIVGGELNRESLGKLANPPMIALLIAASLNFSGLDQSIPQWLGVVFKMLGGCAIPLGIILAGASVCDFMKGKAWRQEPKIHFGAIGVRVLILPILFIAIAILTPGLSMELRQVILIQAAMPAGIFPIVLSKHYGGQPDVAVKVVLATTLVSLVSIPLWTSLGLSLLN